MLRVINDSGGVNSVAHDIGEDKGWRFVLHSLVDFGVLGGMEIEGSVIHYVGSKSGFKSNDSGSQTNSYTILYTGMNDDLTAKAVSHVLSLEKFGGLVPDKDGNLIHNNEKAKEKYTWYWNNCHAFTGAVFSEYEKLWKENYQAGNSDASRNDIENAWNAHHQEISQRQNEEVTFE